jgi:hypothetical protein
MSCSLIARRITTGLSIRGALLAYAAMFCIVGAAAPAEAEPIITKFRISGAVETVPLGINDNFEIAGSYQDSHGWHGFVRATDGTITTLDVPGSCASCGGTDATAINDGGVVGGRYYTNYNQSNGFVRASDGTITTFSVPESSFVFVYGINAKGEIAGYYLDSNSVPHGFVRHINGTVRPFDVPGSATTLALGINDKGEIAGQYSDCANSNCVIHGFLRTSNGTINAFDPPGGTGTFPTCINDGGEIAGYYTSSDGDYHGFVRAGVGTISTIDPPRSIFTIPASINKEGDIVGRFAVLPRGVGRGFLRRTDGTFRLFAVRNADNTPVETTPTSVNRQRVITGTYETNGVYGFVLTP